MINCNTKIAKMQAMRPKNRNLRTIAKIDDTSKKDVFTLIAFLDLTVLFW